MTKPELYKTLSRELVLSGLSRSIQVTIETMPCDSDPMDQSFESKEQAITFERKLNDGTYFNAVVIVRAVFYNGVMRGIAPMGNTEVTKGV